MRKLLNVVHQNWFVAFTSACTIVALPLSLYLFFRGDRHPRLTYAVQSLRSVVVDPPRASPLELSIASKPISTSVIAVQIRVANDGTAPIRAQQILQSPEIVLAAGTILDARVLSRSRSVTAFSLGRVTDSRIPLLFRILEPQDNAVVQVIYAGLPDAEIRLDGAIEGQRFIERSADRKEAWRQFITGFVGGVVVPAFSFAIVWLLLKTPVRPSGFTPELWRVVFLTIGATMIITSLGFIAVVAMLR